MCYSGGHSSALVAIEATRKYGKKNVILLNHDISPKVEHADIKRFKRDVADYLDIPITYANMPGWEKNGPLEVSLKERAFEIEHGNTLCTSRLKTRPFEKWLKNKFPASFDAPDKDITILYGFDASEKTRMQRRANILGAKGYQTDFPLTFWSRSLSSTEDIGIPRPITYKIFKHANCIGCLKAGRQHWYIVYCLYPEIFQQAIEAERELGYSIINGAYLEELELKYKEMRDAGICPNDREQSQTFWARVNRHCPEQISYLPCECSI